MKLEKTENLKLQNLNNVQTTTTQNNKIQDSDTILSNEISKILNNYQKNPNFKSKRSFKQGCNYCRRLEHIIAECRQD